MIVLAIEFLLICNITNRKLARSSVLESKGRIEQDQIGFLAEQQKHGQKQKRKKKQPILEATHTRVETALKVMTNIIKEEAIWDHSS